MKEQITKQRIHFTDKEITQRVNPVLVNLIGIGGTGSHVLTHLTAINEVLWAMGHSGLVVRAFDADTVSPYNLGRQRYARSEVGIPKAAAKINRINRTCGTYWQAMLFPFSLEYEKELLEFLPAQITISCVDKVKWRFEIEEILNRYVKTSIKQYDRDKPSYWMDFGNNRYTGQVMLSTLRSIPQPNSEKFETVSSLPLFTEEYRTDLKAIDDNAEPSCSMQEALIRQDLFINPTIALYGCRLLYALLTKGMVSYRGVFVNIENPKVVPIPITPAVSQEQHNETSVAQAA